MQQGSLRHLLCHAEINTNPYNSHTVRPSMFSLTAFSNTFEEAHPIQRTPAERCDASEFHDPGLLSLLARKKKSVIPRFPISFYNPVAGIKFYGTPCRIRLTFIWCNSGSHKTTLLAIKERGWIYFEPGGHVFRYQGDIRRCFYYNTGEKRIFNIFFFLSPQSHETIQAKTWHVEVIELR